MWICVHETHIWIGGGGGMWMDGGGDTWMDGDGSTWADGGGEKSVILAPIKMLTSDAGLWMCRAMGCVCGRVACEHVGYGGLQMG